MHRTYCPSTKRETAGSISANRMISFYIMEAILRRPASFSSLISTRAVIHSSRWLIFAPFPRLRRLGLIFRGEWFTFAMKCPSLRISNISPDIPVYSSYSRRRQASMKLITTSLGMCVHTSILDGVYSMCYLERTKTK